MVALQARRSYSAKKDVARSLGLALLVLANLSPGIGHAQERAQSIRSQGEIGPGDEVLFRRGPARGSVRRADCAAVSELIAFVADHGNRHLEACPPVSVTSAAALIAAIAPNASAHGMDPRAAYVAASGEILLAPDIALSTPLGRSYVVHELVHAHQFESAAHLRAPCPGWLEADAYRVQASYLRKHGFAKDAFAFELLGLLQSACGQLY